MAQALDGGFEQHVVRDWAMWACVKGKMLEVVPSSRGDPVIFWLVGLRADKASWISDAKCADGANV